MKMACLAALALVLPACARFQPTTAAVSPSNYTLSGMTKSFTMKDSSIHYDPAVLKIGNSRESVQAAFGEPNASQTTDSGLTEDVYAFNPDGSKFVNPQIRPRNFALAFFTMGTSVAVRQARLHLAERKLTLYHVVYDDNGAIESVREEKMSKAPDNGPALQQPEATPSN
ncbi:MAG TPA: hypothetical protein VJ718_07805 [Candidatus Binataceae bacterium]|jgi:hypothetical protein|nr:hypothetical protein [Candidatus Binataceae bacterium]